MWRPPPEALPAAPILALLALLPPGEVIGLAAAAGSWLGLATALYESRGELRHNWPAVRERIVERAAFYAALASALTAIVYGSVELAIRL